MKKEELYKSTTFYKEFVPYPLSPFKDGHIKITEGPNRTPLCMLPMPMGMVAKGVERQEKNAEMIRRLPKILDVLVDVVVAKEINEDDLKALQAKCNKLLKYKK